MADKSTILIKEIRDSAGDIIGGISGDIIKIGSTSVTSLIAAIQAVLQSDDTALDTIQELVGYIKANRTDINSILTAKVDKTAIYNALDSVDTGKVLSAAQGKALKALIDGLSTSLSTLEGEVASVSGEAGQISFAAINDGDAMPTNIRAGGLVMVLG